MKFSKRLLIALLSVTLIITCNSGLFIIPVKAEESEEVTTKDSWIDPGNYTRGWFDVVTGEDIYGNAGTQEDPYEIKSAKDLAGLAYYSNIVSTDSATTDFGGKYITITASTIDLSAHYWYPIGAVQNFKGVVNGNGVTIENMYIGSASKYETCGKVGLFGSVYADIKDIAVKNTVIYSNSSYASGFVGYWLGGNITNCSVEGQMLQIASSSYVGGFAGYHGTDGSTIKNSYAKMPLEASTAQSSCIGGFIGDSNAVTTVENCYATGSITAGASCKAGGFAGYCNGNTFNQCYGTGSVTTEASSSAGGFAGYSNNETFNQCYGIGEVTVGASSSVGGFVGYCSSGVFTQCYEKGDVTGGTSCSAGGFAGYIIIGKHKECFALGNVKIESGNAGGFIGVIRCNNIYNSYALGKVEAGVSSNIGGFIGYAYNYYKTSYSMNIENCYAAGALKGGSSSTISGFFGARQCGYTTITFKKDYWNLSADQVLNGSYIANDNKVAVNYGTFQTVASAYESYMKSEEFAADLNEYVYQNEDNYQSWELTENVNEGFPYLSENEAALLTLTGGSKDITTEDDEMSNSMNVYGTLIFQEPEESEEPEEPEEPAISVGLEWGSLEYVYTSGEWNKESNDFEDGSWSPKEAGVTDKITVTNQSEDSDVQANYSFMASTEGTGSYADLTGEFDLQEPATAVTSPVIIRSKQGDIVASQDVYLKIAGIPIVKKKVVTPEVIGNVVVTISRYEVESEPETTVSETPSSSATSTETVSASPSATSTETLSPSPSESPTVTLSPSPSATVSESVTESPIETVSPSPSATVSESVTESPIETVSPSPIVSASATATSTEIASPSPS